MICDDYDFGLLLNASPCFALVIMQTLADGQAKENLELKHCKQEFTLRCFSAK